jgi:hypothetical protein
MSGGNEIHKAMQKMCDDDLKARDVMAQHCSEGGNRKGIGKVKMNLVFHDMAEALYEVCKVMTEGAKKHEPKGWVKVPNGIYEYTEDLHRHINAEARGELRDKEWDLLHAAHAACCALIRCQLVINELKPKTEPETVHALGDDGAILQSKPISDPSKFKTWTRPPHEYFTMNCNATRAHYKVVCVLHRTDELAVLCEDIDDEGLTGVAFSIPKGTIRMVTPDPYEDIMKGILDRLLSDTDILKMIEPFGKKGGEN